MSHGNGDVIVTFQTSISGSNLYGGNVNPSAAKTINFTFTPYKIGMSHLCFTILNLHNFNSRCPPAPASSDHAALVSDYDAWHRVQQGTCKLDARTQPSYRPTKKTYHFFMQFTNALKPNGALNDTIKTYPVKHYKSGKLECLSSFKRLYVYLFPVCTPSIGTKSSTNMQC